MDASQLPDAVYGDPDASTGLGFWEVCVEHGDCESGICYRAQESDATGHCTHECDGFCPDGFACKVVLIADFSDLRVCIPAEETFCDPCTANAGCGDSGDFCVALTAGLVCTIDCSDDPTVCPAGFTCQTVSGTGDTVVGQQCMPTNGICCVDGDGDIRGEGSGCLNTDCDDDNAAVYDDADEICDGFDNDCIGGVDVDPIDCAVAECLLGAFGYYELPAEPCEGAVCTPQSSSLCDLYTCSEGGDSGDQCADACDGEDDGKCVPTAHCDAAVCYLDLANGQACDETSDCSSDHCQNAYCCDFGDCCTVAQECPTWGTSVAICNDPSTCQGTRGEPVCQSFICQSGGGEQDDSACTAATVSDDCDWYLSVFCNGAVSQPAPSCPTSCASHADCDPGGFCDPASDTCVEDRDDGEQCDEEVWCKSGHCQNGFCCDDGDCCSMPADCPGSYSDPPVCDIPSACHGTRDDATCIDHECGTLPNVDDDSACHSGIEASNCGPYISTYCNGQVTQTPPDCYTACTGAAQCDPFAHCDAFGNCVADVPLGGNCGGTGDCLAGLLCVDGVCCDGACGGICEACNLSGNLGHCSAVPAGQDPAGECLGGSCAGYYWGWSGTTCHQRADLTDIAATCQADGTCLTPVEACPSQPQGADALTCDGFCESPSTGTCTGTTAGTCTDDSLLCYDYTTCEADVRMCLGSCPVQPTEVCDLVDNDCDTVIDEGFYGDSSNGNVDFPNSNFGPILASYPTGSGDYHTSGTITGKILPAGDEDWFAVAATEELSDFCLTDSQDEDIQANVSITPPGTGLWYTVCACWSSATSLCGLSSQSCVTGMGGISSTMNIDMDMSCGNTDVGYLDIQVTPDLVSLDLSCDEYTVTWEVWEND